RDDGADEADAQGLVSRDPLTGEDHFERSAAPDEARQALGAAGEREQAHRDFGNREAGALCGDSNVAGERELQAGADGLALKSADDGLRQVREAAEWVRRDAVAAQCRDWVCRLDEQGVPVPAAGERIAFSR